MREAVAGEEQVEGKAKKRRKNNGGEVQPEVTRVEVEEVSGSHLARSREDSKYEESLFLFFPHLGLTPE